MSLQEGSDFSEAEGFLKKDIPSFPGLINQMLFSGKFLVDVKHRMTFFNVSLVIAL